VHPCGMVGDTVHIALLDCDTLPKPLEVTNIITPNGDGLNDALVFGNLPPGSSLTIYSRWGRRIFLAENYLNDWDADGMTDGTYFYVLALPSGEAVKGYVTVVR
jgi:gliding motility-associated-like protein